MLLRAYKALIKKKKLKKIPGTQLSKNYQNT